MSRKKRSQEIALGRFDFLYGIRSEAREPGGMLEKAGSRSLVVVR